MHWQAQVIITIHSFLQLNYEKAVLCAKYSTLKIKGVPLGVGLVCCFFGVFFNMHRALRLFTSSLSFGYNPYSISNISRALMWKDCF